MTLQHLIQFQVSYKEGNHQDSAEAEGILNRMYHTGKCLLSELSDDGRLFYLKDTKQTRKKSA